MSGMRVEVEALAGGRIRVMTLSGLVDAYAFERLDQAFRDIFDEECSRVIVDLGEVASVSSTAVGIFMSSQSTAAEHGGGLVLVNPQAAVRSVIEHLGLTKIVSVCDTVDEAVAFFENK